MPKARLTREIALAAAITAGLTVLLLLVYPKGFPNYDTIYYLLWGKEIAEGMSPDYGAPLAPTPHPLYDLLGAATAPLGDGSITVAMAIAYVSLGLIAYFVYRLGREWFSAPVGAAAAVIIMTSAPILSNGLRAYIDLPYMAMCLAALLIETRRPRAGWPVLALLLPAGLLRPEAWVFAFAYLAYVLVETRWGEPGAPAGPRRGGLWSGSPPSLGVGKLRFTWRAERSGRDVLGLAALAAAGPVLWVLFDLITTGDAMYSFSGTRENVETLERETGPVDVVLYGPRRLGEVLQWPGMVGAAAGLALGLLAMARRVAVGVGAAALALLAFALMGATGLAIIPRYTMLAAAILAVFAGAALLGWLLLEPGSRWRRPWQGAAALVLLLYLVWAPNQYDLLAKVDRDLTAQSLVERDLEALVDEDAFEGVADGEACLPISVPNHRAVPRLAFWLDLRPTDVVSVADADRQPRTGFFLAPARDFTIENFILDPGEEGRAAKRPPPGFRQVAENRSWVLYRRCG